MIFLYTFCCDINRFDKSQLSNVLKMLLKSLDKNVSEYKLICFSNFIDQLKTDIDHMYNIEFREYYDNTENKLYSCKWQNLSFNKINVYKDLYDEFQTNFCWIDLDTIICADVSYINDLSNVFIENGGNCTRENLLFSNDNSITIPRNRYIQGNFWKLSINLYEELMKTLKELNDKNLKLRYDLQDLFGYYIYIKNDESNCKVNVIGKNVKEEIVNGLCVWEESGDCHPSIEGLENLYITETGELKSNFYPDKVIHILSFTFYKILELYETKQFKYLFENEMNSGLDNIEYNKVSIDENETKIAVVTFFTSNYTIGFETLKINKAYCKKHNYDFYFFDSLEESLKHKHAAWHKLFYVNKILKEHYYEHVVWIDADAFFCNDNIRIEKFITCDKNFIVQRDPGYSLETFNIDKIKINTGLFICKNTDWSKNFLDFIIHNQEFSEWDTKHNWEQNAIRRCIEKNYMNTLDNIFIIKDTFFNNNTHNVDEFINNGGFVLHMTNFMGQYRDSRESKLYKFLHRNEDEKRCEYVSIRGIAKNCDHFPQSIVSDTIDFDPNEYRCIKENDIVFVITSVLDKFVQIILPTLGDTKFKLITGACVKGVPHEISSIHKNNYIKIFQKNVTRWYTQNFDGTIECVPIPLGIDYHTLQRGNHPWGPMASATEQETILKEASNFNFEDKTTRTFSSFHFQLFGRHDRDRHRAIDHLKNVKFNDVIKNPVPRKSLWNCMRSYKFIISPHGNGLDCHRTYESIILGSVPIVRSSTLDGLYEGMPVLIVDDWKDITKEVLENYTYIGDLEKLKLNYWISLIKNNEC